MGFGPRADECSFVDDRARKDDGIDACVHIITHYDAQFSTPGIHLTILDVNSDATVVET